MSAVFKAGEDLLGGVFGGPAAAEEAGAAGERAALAGVEELRRQFDITQEQLAPFREAGVRSLGAQEALLGLAGPEAQQQAFAQLQESPGQRFLRERQQRALLRNQAAIGGLGGGNIRTALQQQAAGFAQQDIQNQFGRLAGLTGGGGQAATNIGQFGQQTASGISGLLGQAGQARASGILGAQQARAGMVQQGTQLAALALSDERFKEDIEDLDLRACFEAVVNMPLKSWKYLEAVGLDTDTHFGPMAQDAPEMTHREVDGIHVIDLHDELMMIAGAIQFMKNNNLLRVH